MLTRTLRRVRLRPWLLAGIAAVIFLEIIVFSPNPVDETKTTPGAINPESLVATENHILAQGIPKNRIPDYTVERFTYLSTHGMEKEWRLNANTAYLFNREKLVHAKQVKAFLYDPDGKITVVTGKEAKYLMNNRDLEFFGDVTTIFPDGFELHSEYLHHRPSEHLITIPSSYGVTGDGSHQKGGSSGQKLSFQSRGIEYKMTEGRIQLPQAAQIQVKSPTGEDTRIEADHCLILRKDQIAHFTMSPSHPLESRFIHITQPSLLVRGRRADLNYGDYSKAFNYMVTFEDVLIREVPKPGKSQLMKYATGGQASFDTQRNLITLTEFPQVYQENDTVTGDIIIMHRDSDVIEVEHSNAFSQGSQ